MNQTHREAASEGFEEVIGLLREKSLVREDLVVSELDGHIGQRFLVVETMSELATSLF